MSLDRPQLTARNAATGEPQVFVTIAQTYGAHSLLLAAAEARAWGMKLLEAADVAEGRPLFSQEWCGPAMWAGGRKCCPDCIHGEGRGGVCSGCGALGADVAPEGEVHSRHREEEVTRKPPIEDCISNPPKGAA